jgi:hypothetical protein
MTNNLNVDLMTDLCGILVNMLEDKNVQAVSRVLVILTTLFSRPEKC